MDDQIIETIVNHETGVISHRVRHTYDDGFIRDYLIVESTNDVDVTNLTAKALTDNKSVQVIAKAVEAQVDSISASPAPRISN